MLLSYWFTHYLYLEIDENDQLKILEEDSEPVGVETTKYEDYDDYEDEKDNIPPIEHRYNKNQKEISRNFSENFNIMTI